MQSHLSRQYKIITSFAMGRSMKNILSIQLRSPINVILFWLRWLGYNIIKLRRSWRFGVSHSEYTCLLLSILEIRFSSWSLTMINDPPRFLIILCLLKELRSLMAKSEEVCSLFLVNKLVTISPRWRRSLYCLTLRKSNNSPKIVKKLSMTFDHSTPRT